MATNHEESVTKALFDHLETLTTSPATSIAMPDVKFTGSTPYLRVNLIPTRSGSISESGSLKRHTGILQISVVTERGSGIQAANRIADDICQHFRHGVLIFGSDGRAVQIIEPPYTEAMFQDDKENITPVSILYSSFSEVSAA